MVPVRRYIAQFSQNLFSLRENPYSIFKHHGPFLGRMKPALIEKQHEK